MLDDSSAFILSFGSSIVEDRVRRRQFLELAAAVALARWAGLWAQNTETLQQSIPPGAWRLQCHWQQSKRDKYTCDLSATNKGALAFTQLFVNGQPQVRARFPHAAASGEPVFVNGVRFLPQGLIVPDFGGDIKDQDLFAIEFDPTTFGRSHWGNPQEALLCLKVASGLVRMPVFTIDYDRNLIWCELKRASSLDIHDVPQFYVENVREEWRAQHEWYLDRQQGILYYRAPHGLDMNTAVIDAA